MRFLRSLVTGGILVSGLAAASPATDLLDQAIQFMTQNYHGYSAVNPGELGLRLKADLERACAGRADCGFNTATPYLLQLAAGMNDGHTYYLSPGAYQNELQAFSGVSTNPNPTFGIFVGSATSRGEVLIQDVIAGGPAFNGGLRPFDRVTRVNGEKLQLPNAVTRFRELIQTDAIVRLEVSRGDTRNPVGLTVSMKRRKLTKTNLPFTYQPANAPAGVLVMRFPTFIGSNDIAPRAHRLVLQAQTQGARAIVIDLRGNPGGEETECYGASSAFIGRAANINETATQRVTVGFDGGRFLGNDPKDPTRFEIPHPALWQGDVAVLVDRGTASCGELMAYFIQSAKRGKVIGQRTYGVLDTATEFWKLIDGSALAITYVRTLNEDGSPVPSFITPDVEAGYEPGVIGETGRDAMLDRALEVLGTK